MPYRSRNNSLLERFDPWTLSSALHALMAIAALFVFSVSVRLKPTQVDIQIVEKPPEAAHPVRVVEPKVKPIVIPPRREEPAKVQPERAPAHEVFGISPKSVFSEDGEGVKIGNTVAKKPDQEILKPGDPTALPVPTEEYLVTSMPQLKSEVRVPYPPECRRKGIQGAVVMDLLIDEHGKVCEATLVESPDKDLSAAALAAAKGFQFTAAMMNDKPVAVRIRYRYRFVLER